MFKYLLNKLKKKTPTTHYTIRFMPQSVNFWLINLTESYEKLSDAEEMIERLAKIHNGGVGLVFVVKNNGSPTFLKRSYKHYGRV